MCLRVFRDVQGCLMCLGVCEVFRRVQKCFGGCLGEFSSVQRCLEMFSGVQGCLGVFRNVQGCLDVFGGVSGCFGMFRGFSGCLGVVRGVQGCVQASTPCPRQMFAPEKKKQFIKSQKIVFSIVKTMVFGGKKIDFDRKAFFF